MVLVTSDNESQIEVVGGVLVIPEGTQSIGNDEFRERDDFSIISFPMSLNEIGARAFQGCANLKELDVPANVEIIEDEAFDGCTALKMATLSSNRIRTKSKTFGNCTSLETFTALGNEFKFLESGIFTRGTFEGCDSLKALVMTVEAWEANWNEDWEYRYDHRKCVGGLRGIDLLSLKLNAQVDFVKSNEAAVDNKVVPGPAVSAFVSWDRTRILHSYSGYGYDGESYCDLYDQHDNYYLSIGVGKDPLGRKATGFEIDAPLCFDRLKLCEMTRKLNRKLGEWETDFSDSAWLTETSVDFKGAGTYFIQDSFVCGRIKKARLKFPIAHRPPLKYSSIEKNKYNHDPMLIAIYCFRLRVVFEDGTSGPWSKYHISEIGSSMRYLADPDTVDIHYNTNNSDLCEKLARKAVSIFRRLGTPASRFTKGIESFKESAEKEIVYKKRVYKQRFYEESSHDESDSNGDVKVKYNAFARGHEKKDIATAMFKIRGTPWGILVKFLLRSLIPPGVVFSILWITGWEITPFWHAVFAIYIFLWAYEALRVFYRVWSMTYDVLPITNIPSSYYFCDFLRMQNNRLALPAFGMFLMWYFGWFPMRTWVIVVYCIYGFFWLLSTIGMFMKSDGSGRL